MISKWAGCNVNCGTKCPVKVHTQDGIIKYFSIDNEGDDSFDNRQSRACANRLKRPLKRCECKFMPISWEQSFYEISTKMQEIKEKYGNEAFYINYATGTIINRCTQGQWSRLLSLYGVYLNYHNSYPTTQISNAMNFFYEGSFSSDIATLRSAKLAIFFGANHVETRMGGWWSNLCLSKNLRRKWM